ncbi:hypothetical protein BEWA_028940 [Theileria equi strain WA]|uniref:Uncharacterized protein n=1 Tax=Theileria equi strain WA TaxID=1537102 RepID=L0AYS6_THEEQ|nr:hypothetical protein BEWA_028940 [Theileria equi strain WA]AFZ80044.1 hypothetical protein BEWA_028940 [Theileria equi strain WA]|eukprot:XP_004829710.1 hypothetical protein BEWA_028940 [Theileria equi strain WA]
MSNVYTLELNLQKKCGENNGPCNCTRDGDFVAKKDDSIPGAIGFIRYTHELRNASEQTFTLQTNLRNRQTIKGDPVPNVKEVAVYFWKDHLGKPILIGIKKKGTSPPDYYSNSYISAGKSYWSNAGNENKELAQLLDENNCKRNGAVPFDIQNPTKDHAPGCNSTCLKTRNIGGPSPRPAPPGGEYTIQEYIVNHNSNDYLDNGTKISRVTFGGQSTNGIDLPRSYAVSRVRMFSHADSQSNNIPLMLQFVQKGGTVSRWFYNKDKDGTDWKEVDDVYGFYSDSIGVYPTEDLTTKLDNVRCLRDSLVTMNLGKGVSGSYCCIYHKKKGDQGKVTVSEEIVPAGSIQYSKHSISSGDTKLAKIKFSSQWNQGTEIKITLSKQNLPIMGPVAIYAFYCERNGPVLIYVDRGSAQGWYRKPNSNSSGKDEQWEKADELDGVTPETINNCTHWNKVVSKLRDSNSGLKDCPKETAKRLQEQGQQSERETRTGGEESEGQGYKADAGGKEARAQEQGTSPKKPDPNDKAKGPGDTAPGLSGSAVDEASGNADGDSHSEGTQSPAAKESASEPQARSGAEAGTALPHGQGNSPGQNPSFWDKPEKSIPTVLTGVGVVSGLVGLEGFKYYKSHNGDPWVRQI